MEQKENKIDSLYVQFADKVRRWNSMYKLQAVFIGFCVVFGCGIASVSMWISVSLAYQVAVYFAVIYGMLFSWLYREMYVKIEGKGNRVSQYLQDVRLMVAFSIEDYYKEIERRLKKRTMIIVAIVFAILFLTNVLNLLEHFLEVIGLCFMTIGIVIISTRLSFNFVRFIGVRSYYSQKKRKRKIRKDDKHTENQFWKDYPLWFAIIVFTVAIIIGVLALYRNYFLRVPNDMNIYRTITNSFWLTYPVVICALYGGEQIGRLITGKSGSIKKVIGYGLVIVISIVYSFTFYTTYYEDKIVINRFLQTKEYAWSDVQAYMVKKNNWSHDIQLELKMQDCTLDVISIYNTSSEKYEEEYYSYYEYIAHLVEKMDGYGISGILEDEEVIAPDEEIDGPYEIEAFDRIKSAVYGTQEQEKNDGK